MAIILLLAVGDGRAAADEFRLTGGGTILGQWLNRDESPRRHYHIELAPGRMVQLPAAAVSEVVPRPLVLAEYERLAPARPDTVAGHWEMSQWCREQGLEAQRRVHLERILELDSDHAAARRLLGYVFLNGRWTRGDAHLREQGYVLYRGRWRLIQEVELLERASKRELFEKQWLARLRRWRGDLPTDKGAAAARSLASVSDAYAVKPLADMLRQDAWRPARLLYIDALVNIGPEGAPVLVATALDDADEEVRYAAIAGLKKLAVPGVAAALSPALKDDNNVRLNRAAAALAELGDDSVLAPLIEALVTVHRVTVASGGSSETVSASFSPTGGFGGPGGGGLSTGGGPLVVPVTAQNQQVLRALVRLTGVSYGFDQRAWRAWLASRATP